MTQLAQRALVDTLSSDADRFRAIEAQRNEREKETRKIDGEKLKKVKKDAKELMGRGSRHVELKKTLKTRLQDLNKKLKRADNEVQYLKRKGELLESKVFKKHLDWVEENVCEHVIAPLTKQNDRFKEIEDNWKIAARLRANTKRGEDLREFRSLLAYIPRHMEKIHVGLADLESDVSPFHLWTSGKKWSDLKKPLKAAQAAQRQRESRGKRGAASSSTSSSSGSVIPKPGSANKKRNAPPGKGQSNGIKEGKRDPTSSPASSVRRNRKNLKKGTNSSQQKEGATSFLNVPRDAHKRMPKLRPFSDE